MKGWIDGGNEQAHKETDNQMNKQIDQRIEGAGD